MIKLQYVLWRNIPRNFSTTCTLVSNEPKRLVIGTKVGHLLLYSIQKRCTPFSILSGHESRVCDLTVVRYHSSNCCCSVSSDGTICVWDLRDGLCVLYLPFVLSGIPSKIVSLKGGSRVACCGDHNQIEIVDLNKGLVVMALRGHKDWISGISCGVFQSEKQQYGVVLSASLDQSLSFWILKKTEKVESNLQLNCKSTVRIHHKERPLAVQQNSQWSYVLVVFRSKWCVYAFNCASPACEMDSTFPLKGGFFLNDHHVFLFSDDGKALVYRLQPLAQPIQIDLETGEKEEDDFDWMMEDIEERPQSEVAGTGDNTQGKAGSPEPENLQNGEKRTPTPPVPDVHGGKYSEIDPSERKSYYRQQLQKVKQAEKRRKIVTNLLGIFNRKKPKKQKPKHKGRKDYSNLKVVTNGVSPKNVILSPKPMEPKAKPKKPLVENSPLETPTLIGDSINVPTPKFHGRTLSFEGNLEAPSLGAMSFLEDLNDSLLEESIEQEIERPELVKELTVDEKIEDVMWEVFCDKFLVRVGKAVKNNDRIEFLQVSEYSIVDGSFSLTEVPVSDESRCSSISSDVRTTSSYYHFNGDIPVVVYGLENGEIEITPLFGEKIVKFSAHDSPVSAVVVVSVTNSEGRREILVTGADDGLVKMWDFRTSKHIKSFRYHTRRITNFFTPPKNFKTLHNCICSISEDRSVIIYHLHCSVSGNCHFEMSHVFGGHTSNVVSVHFRHDLDKHFVVRCLDGSVFLWNISSGVLEKRVFSIEAKELIETMEGRGTYKKPVLKMSLQMNVQDFINRNVSSMYSCFSLKLDKSNSSTLMVSLNVRKLLSCIEKEKKQIKEKFGRTCVFRQELWELPLEIRSALGLLFLTGKNCHTLDVLKSIIKVPTPSLFVHVALKGVRSTYSLMLPNEKKEFHSFLFSEVLSAVQIVSVIAVLNSLGYIPELKQLCGEIRKYYLENLYSLYHDFANPSFLWCSQFLKEETKVLQFSARSVMGSVLNRMQLADVKVLAKKLSDIILENLNSIEQTKKQNIIVSLAVLSYRVPKAVDKRIATLTANGLIEIMESGGSQHTTAISLLGEGYSIWKFYVSNPSFLWEELFKLSLPALTRTKGSGETDSLSLDSLKAFLNVSCIDTDLYIQFLKEMFSNAQGTPPQTLSAIILTLSPLIEKYPQILVDYLVIVTSLLLTLIDPQVSSLRKNQMKPTIKILRKMVEKYPMIAFHQSKQKLAVGNQDGIIIIFDLVTASKWQLFEAHDGPCRILSFSKSGKNLASFSPIDGRCKVWNVDGSGVLNLLVLSFPFYFY